MENLNIIDINPINTALKPVDGYLFTIIRNTLNGCYDIEMGLPNKWVYNETKYISCEILNENNDGKLIKISSKNDSIVVDDLIRFAGVIIQINQKIAEKENEINEMMENKRKEFEKDLENSYKELDEMKDKSFNDLHEDVNESTDGNIEIKKDIQEQSLMKKSKKTK